MTGNTTVSGSSEHSTTKPTIILVTVAWMTTIHTKPIEPLFTKAGYRFKPVQLPSVGIQDPRATYQGDVNGICNHLEEETKAGNGICLILHSYAGIPGRDALSQFLTTSNESGGGKLVKTIFIAAQLDDFDKEIIDTYYTDFIHFGNGYNTLNNPARLLFGDLSVREAQPFVDALQPQTYPLGDTNIGDPTGKLPTEIQAKTKKNRRGGEKWIIRILFA